MNIISAKAAFLGLLISINGVVSVCAAQESVVKKPTISQQVKAHVCAVKDAVWGAGRFSEHWIRRLLLAGSSCGAVLYVVMRGGGQEGQRGVVNQSNLIFEVSRNQGRVGDVHHRLAQAIVNNDREDVIACLRQGADAVSPNIDLCFCGSRRPNQSEQNWYPGLTPLELAQLMRERRADRDNRVEILLQQGLRALADGQDQPLARDSES